MVTLQFFFTLATLSCEDFIRSAATLKAVGLLTKGFL